MVYETGQVNTTLPRHHSYPNPLYSLRHVTGQCDLNTECFAYEVAYTYTDI
ncbi:hypothetical protein VPHF99_0287 [Vibrio phage F99]